MKKISQEKARVTVGGYNWYLGECSHTLHTKSLKTTETLPDTTTAVAPQVPVATDPAVR